MIARHSPTEIQGWVMTRLVGAIQQVHEATRLPLHNPHIVEVYPLLTYSFDDRVAQLLRPFGRGLVYFAAFAHNVLQRSFKLSQKPRTFLHRLSVRRQRTFELHLLPLPHPCIPPQQRHLPFCWPRLAPFLTHFFIFFAKLGQMRLDLGFPHLFLCA